MFVNGKNPSFDGKNPAFNRFEPAVNRVESAVNRIEPEVNRFEPAVDRVEPAINRIKPAVDRVESAVYGLHTLQEQAKGKQHRSDETANHDPVFAFHDIQPEIFSLKMFNPRYSARTHHVSLPVDRRGVPILIGHFPS